MCVCAVCVCVCVCARVFSFQLLFQYGMYHHVYEMVRFNGPLLLIGKSRPCSGGDGFPLSLSE